jgi:hypothetical protein
VPGRNRAAREPQLPAGKVRQQQPACRVLAPACMPAMQLPACRTSSAASPGVWLEPACPTDTDRPLAPCTFLLRPAAPSLQGAVCRGQAGAPDAAGHRRG